METKYKLHLGVLEDVNDISSVIIASLSSEFLIDTIRGIIRKYNKETDLTKFMDDFADLIDESYNANYSNYRDWIVHKNEVTTKMIELVKSLDEFLCEKKLIEDFDVMADMLGKYKSFVLSLSNLKIDTEYLDASDLDLDKEYIKSALEELRLLDEGVLMSNLVDSPLEITPLDVERNRNVFIEEKLNKINKVADSCEHIFDNDYEKLLNQILSMYDKFYTVCFGSYTDGEKSEKARKIAKVVSPHKLVLDKLENKLTTANEIKRQLKIHEKRLKEGLDVQKEGYTRRMEENPEEKDIFENEMNSVNFVTENYFSEIEKSIARVNDLEEKIAKHYKVIDQLDIALKTAIPTEVDMNKYTALGYKFQELLVRLELSKSQVDKKDKTLLTLINTAVTGLGELIVYTVDIKDLYLRDAMLSAVFRTVNTLNDFATNANKSIELSKIKFITDKLAKYSAQEQLFTGDLLTYRKVANNAIRDISIIMGKPIDAKGMLEIIDLIDITIKQFKHLEDSLDSSHDEQTQLMRAIMEI